MKDIIITSSDYSDLNENLSEKNIINTVYGKEYEITFENSSIAEITIEPDILSELFKEYYGEGYYISKYNSKLLSNFGKATGLNPLFTQINVYARVESMPLSGYQELEIEEVLDASVPLNCKFTINYTKSKVNLLTSNNYDDVNRTAFFDESTFPILENDGDNNLTLEENIYLPISTGKGMVVPSSGIITDIVSLASGKYKTEIEIPNIEEYCYAKIISQTNKTTKIGLWYSFRIWNCWSDEKYIVLTSTNNGQLYYVNNIKINIEGCRVQKNEINFEYPLSRVSNQNRYELESNELMQTTLMNYRQVDVNANTMGTYYIYTLNEETGNYFYKEVELPNDYVVGTIYYETYPTLTEDKLSYKTYQKIVEAYNTDRRIISFDLLNPIKITIDDTEKYSNGQIENRYLDSDDEFTIYDEHNKYIGDFRVIQCNPIWDGSYHKIITGILIGEDEIKSNFADNSWEVIAWAFRSGNASKYWKVGDTKPVQLNGQTYTVRIVDMKMGRYDYSSGSNKTNGVFEFVELMPNTSVMLETATVNQTYKDSYLRNTTLPQIYEMLPKDLKDIIKPINIPSFKGTGYGTEIIYSSEKIFIPSGAEVVNAINNKDGAIFDYYTKNVFSKGYDCWGRSPSTSSNALWSVIYNNGTFGFNAPNELLNISIFFAI